MTLEPGWEGRQDISKAQDGSSLEAESTLFRGLELGPAPLLPVPPPHDSAGTYTQMVKQAKPIPGGETAALARLKTHWLPQLPLGTHLGG